MGIIGVSYYPDRQARPVYWYDTNAVPTDLMVLDGYLPEQSYDKPVFGINSLGQMVGTLSRKSEDNLTDNIIPVYWSDPNPNTPPIKINLNGYLNAIVSGINNLGQIVGWLVEDTHTVQVYWSNYNANPIKLAGNSPSYYVNGINDLGQIVGISSEEGLGKPVYWASYNTMPITLNLNGSNEGIANSINNLGQIVGHIISDGLINPVYWANYNAVPIKLILKSTYQGFATGINNLGQIVGNLQKTIDNIDNIDILLPVYWTNSSADPIELNRPINSSTIVSGISDPSPPLSNICFPAKTPVQTDQGIINIDLIDKAVHTINGKPIRHITKTISLDKYLISLDKNSLGRNMPSAKTIMSKEHKIMYDGRLIPVYKFLEYTEKVKKVKYNGETLYNVLLANYGLMVVNNLVCETLHPENIIAKLYLMDYTDKERGKIVYQLNTSLSNRDLISYKEVVAQLINKT